LVKLGVVAEKVLTASGAPAAKALANLSSQNARRLVMLADDAGTATLASNTDLLALFARYGDRAMDFVWRNKLHRHCPSRLPCQPRTLSRWNVATCRKRTRFVDHKCS